MFEWMNKPDYLWVFKDRMYAMIEVFILLCIIYALVIWWHIRK